MVPQHHVRAFAAVCATQSPWPSTIRACDSSAKFTTRFHPLTPARSSIGFLDRQAIVADPREPSIDEIDHGVQVRA
jgi:hypothetical protein